MPYWPIFTHSDNLPCQTIQLDEIWSFVGCKESAKEISKMEHSGDVWTWTSICADTKLIPSWRVGDRSGMTAFAFCSDLSKRFVGTIQITSDDHAAYRWAVDANFPDADYAQLVKSYGKDKDGNEICTGAKKLKVHGAPDIDLVSTSYMERANLTIRMINRRFTRKTNAFSKKLENHIHMLDVSFMHYNFCRKHSTIKTTPAQKAGIADHQWTLEEVIEMMDARALNKEALAFEAAFEMKWSRPRSTPKAYTPTPKDRLKTP